jgi:hypothetical protein
MGLPERCGWVLRGEAERGAESLPIRRREHIGIFDHRDGLALAAESRSK